MTTSRRLPRLVGLLLAQFLLARTAPAVTIVPGVSGGVMQQPTSNYYLACYGLSFDATSKDGGFIVRGSYIERPQFSQDGYSEQDRAISLMAGSTAMKILGGVVRGMIGPGRVSGFVARTAADNKTVIERRSYELYGPAASIEYAYMIKKAVLALNHTTLVGFAGKDQTNALVAWPYNFYALTFGISI